MSPRILRLTGTLCVAAALCLAARTSAAQQPQTQAPPARAAQPTPSSAAPAPSGLQQVQGYTLSPAQAAQALAYARARHELYFIDVVYGLLLLVLILHLRVAPKYRDWTANVGDRSFLQTIFFGALLLLTIDVLSLPTAMWGHQLAVRYQQSIQGWASWFQDWAKSEALEITLGGLVIWILYAVVRKSPRRWWFYFWLAAVPLIILGAIAEPLIFDPLFFKFTPLANSQPRLAARIETVVHRAGLDIPQSRMYEVNASTKLKAVNAYAAGLGATKRVVVWDTSIRRMSEDEILYVFGHEMGHYVLGHVRNGIVFASAVLLLFLYLGYRGVDWLLARYGETWGIRGVEDLASLPALLLLLSIFGFLFTPISNAYSRHLEHQADQYGLEVVHGLVPDAPLVAAHSFQIFGEVDLEEPDPSPAVKIWFYNHPPLDERMRFAQTYDPWSQGRAPEFVK